MTQVYSKALDKSININRIIGKIEGVINGPTVVFYAGIHGNETAGVFALGEVIKNIKPETINGTIYAISGNLKALEVNQRFIDKDLNRLWTKAQLKNLQFESNLNSEEKEQLELFKLLEDIINSSSGPFYFIDFHTTSSRTLPFITINDALINRTFSKLFPVPIVLGIEEYLNGPLLSYINELGFVSLGFESGQHEEPAAVSNCISFIYLALVYTNVIEAENVIGFPIHYNQLKSQSKGLSEIFEVVYLHRIINGDVFKMKNEFKSFQNIKKGTPLATSNNKSIIAKHNAKLFMPLYQNKGEEGFFMIKTIKPFFLKLSVLLRRVKVDNLLVLFPGVSWEDKNKEVLKVNLKVTRFFATSIFHLLGYRNKKVGTNYMLLYNRERTSKTAMYKNEIWYK